MWQYFTSKVKAHTDSLVYSNMHSSISLSALMWNQLISCGSVRTEMSTECSGMIFSQSLPTDSAVISLCVAFIDQTRSAQHMALEHLKSSVSAGLSKCGAPLRSLWRAPRSYCAEQKKKGLTFWLS
jgi:hypothetical protein